MSIILGADYYPIFRIKQKQNSDTEQDNLQCIPFTCQEWRRCESCCHAMGRRKPLEGQEEKVLAGQWTDKRNENLGQKSNLRKYLSMTLPNSPKDKKGGREKVLSDLQDSVSVTL